MSDMHLTLPRLALPGAAEKSKPKHRADDEIAHLRRLMRQLEKDNGIVTAANEDLVCALTRTLLELSAAAGENEALKAELGKARSRIWRQAADLARLRQAVINARPRITVAVQRLDRPYVAHVQATPYPLPAATGDISRFPVLRVPDLGQPHTT